VNLDFLTQKHGPLPAWGWIAAGGGVGLLYMHFHKAGPTAASTSPVFDQTGAGGVPSGGFIGGGGSGLGGSTLGNTPTPPIFLTPPVTAPTGSPESPGGTPALPTQDFSQNLNVPSPSDVAKAAYEEAQYAKQVALQNQIVASATAAWNQQQAQQAQAFSYAQHPAQPQQTFYPQSAIQQPQAQMAPGGGIQFGIPFGSQISQWTQRIFQVAGAPNQYASLGPQGQTIPVQGPLIQGSLPGTYGQYVPQPGGGEIFETV
jgi:hypothetical protein